MSTPNFLTTAIDAAEKAGRFLKEHYEPVGGHTVNETTRFDLKLELDVRSQTLISDVLLGAFPDHAFYGEEGLAGNQDSSFQWIVDPIDGTVNYFYGIPHFCVSIALRKDREIILGVIHDPMLNETFAVERGGSATLNGRPIQVSSRSELSDAVITIGFSKTVDSLDVGFQRFQRLAYQVRKTRMMGSAALAMAYIACGRLDAYLEEYVSLWDIAAGILLIEAAGGTVELESLDGGDEKFRIVASNGKLSFD